MIEVGSRVRLLVRGMVGACGYVGDPGDLGTVIDIDHGKERPYRIEVDSYAWTIRMGRAEFEGVA